MPAKRILIVDDESHITYLLSLKLAQLGYTTVTANDGEEGYLRACEVPPDLVITDYQMPILSGYDMAVKLHDTTQTKQVPVLMLTARGHRISPSDLLKTNIQAMLPKPFALHELLARVTEVIGTASAVTATPAQGA